MDKVFKNNSLCILFFLYFIYKRKLLSKLPHLKKQILGFQINGIGNGHLTQAQTVYDVLIKKYKIPVVIIYGRNEGYDSIFYQSKVFYHKINSTNESTNNMDIIKIIKDVIMIKPTRKYENEYKINKWFNFFVSDFLNYRTKQICIAPQFSLNDIKIYIILKLSKLLCHNEIISIHTPSPHTKHIVPPLINQEFINRYIDKKTILAYSVSGNNFPKTLMKISKKYPDYKFKYFTNTKIKSKLSKNITIYKPDKINFKKYLSICGAVLCTSGNELILECVLNKIPNATMPCSNHQFEQVYNCKKYVEKLKYSELLSKSLDLEYLVNKNMRGIHLKLMKCLENKDEQILKLCDI